MVGKKNLGGIGVNLESSDFGNLGFNIADLFSSEKKYSDQEQYNAGMAWIKKLYNKLLPNATYAQFLDALHLDKIGERKPEDEFNSNVRNIGYAVLTNSNVSDKVFNAVVASLGKDKNKLPSISSIGEAFVNPNNMKFTYWDAIKVTSKQGAVQAQVLAKDVQTVAETTFGLAGFVLKYKWYLLGLTAVGVGYFLYQNRAEVVGRLKEKGFKAVGLGK